MRHRRLAAHVRHSHHALTSSLLAHSAVPQNGRCATCQVRLNGRSAAKVCQGATIPGGATRKLSITLDNK